MKTMIIYDNTGYIYLQLTSDNYRVPQEGIQYLEVEIPSNKRIIGVDVSVTPNIPIYENTPIPETQVLKQQLQETQDLLGEYINNKYSVLLND